MNIKPIIDFDGYFISDEGKVFSNLGRGCRDRTKRVDLYEIKPRPAKNGYCRVCMRQQSTNKRVDKYVHRLVAEYFIPNPMNKKIVNHLDCNVQNNRIENLEWCTYKENNDYAMSLKRNIRDELGRFSSGIK